MSLMLLVPARTMGRPAPRPACHQMGVHVDELLSDLCAARAIVAPTRLHALARRSLVPLLVATLAIAGPAVTPALAAGSTITVNTIAHTLADDGTCSFIEAITAANDDVASGAQPGECAAGSGADTIRFAPAIGAEPVDFYGGGPDLESDLTIDGAGVVTLDLGGLGHVRRNAGVVVVKGVTIVNGGNGGIWNQAPGSLTVLDSTITSTAAGAGVYNAGTLILQRTTLSGNHAVAGVRGGGIANTVGGTASVLDSLIATNVADEGGGIDNSGTLVVRRSVFDGNIATMGHGGGIYNLGKTTISASTFTANSAQSGGGIYNLATLALPDVADMALDNVTMTGNSADLQGSAILNQGDMTAINLTVTANLDQPLYSAVFNSLAANTSLTLQNSIVAGNQVSDYGGTALAAASGHNRVGPLSGAIPLSAWLQTTLADNGGPTPTIALVNSATNPFATGGDPAVCAVDPVGGVDQRGVKRPAGSCSQGAVQLELVKPGVTTPNPAFRTSLASGGALMEIVSLSGSSEKVRIAWTGKDNAGGSGIRSYQVSRSVNGGAWASVASGLPEAAVAATLTPGTSYRYRVRATDHDGNVSSWIEGPTFTPRLIQQSSSAVHYHGTWSSTKSTLYSGGSERYAKAAGASVSYTATGRAFALVSTLGAGRGKARIYVDGSYKTTVDLVSVTPFYRVQVWSTRFSKAASHTIKVVVVGTGGRPRVDVDAILVLR